jgi:hypothetical protein
MLVSEYWENNKEKLSAYFDEYYPSKNIFKEYIGTICDEEVSDIDVMVECESDYDFDFITRRIFKTICTNLGLTKPDKKELSIIRVMTDKSYKYNIIGSKIPHKLEVFRTYNLSSVGCTSRFHFPVVRGLYTGSRIWVLPSVLGVANTGVMIDCKWFTRGAPPQSILLKYTSRGYYSLMNVSEHKFICDVIKKNKEQWGQFDERVKDGMVLDKFMSISNSCYKPASARNGIYYSLVNNKRFSLKPVTTIYGWVPDSPNFQDEWRNESKKMGSYKTSLEIRHPAGYIKPIKSWTFEPYVEGLSTSQKYYVK